MLDAAIDRVGAMASVAFADRCFGAARETVVALPTAKDVAGVADVLRDRPVVRWCGLPVAGLDFPSLDPHGRPLADLDEVLSALAGPRIHAIGTWSLFGALATRVGFSPFDDLCSGD